MLLGFDIGGTKCAVVLGKKTSGGNIKMLSKSVLPTNKPVQEMIEFLFLAAENILESNKANKAELKGIGVSCGGPLDSKAGIILSPPNLPGWDNIPIATMIEARFGIRGILQNDANACAVAEWKWGAGKGLEHLIFLTFGTGMGAGLILNGRLYSGASDAAGEAGHVRLTEMGPVGFGKAGSFEGYCSGGGIAQLARIKAIEKIQQGGHTSYCAHAEDMHTITARSVAEAALAGDDTALEVYEICGSYLGRGLSMLIDVLNPQMIVLGGIFLRARSLVEPAMNASLEKETLSGNYKNCRIVAAGLGENIGDMAALALADMG